MAARWRCRVRTPMPLRGACGQPVQAKHRSVSITLARRINKAAMALTRRTNKTAIPFTRRTTSAASAANECEGITCLWQVTRNGSDEAERSERSPPGVARNAGDEGLAAPGGQVSGKAAPANGSASQVNGSPEASGEVRTGDRARRRRAGLEKGPPEPSADDVTSSLWPVTIRKGQSIL